MIIIISKENIRTNRTLYKSSVFEYRFRIDI